MALKIGKSGTGAVSFQLLPKVIKIKNGRQKIKLAAIPSPPIFEPNAAFLASIKGNKKTFTINSRLKSLLKKIGWDKSNLKPLKTLLKNELNSAKKDPTRIIDLLDAHLKIGNNTALTTNFRIKFSPTLDFAAPSMASINLLPQVVQELNFQVIPREIRVKNGRERIRLDAILSTAGLSTKATLTSTITHGKKAFSNSSRLDSVLQQIGWTNADLKPLRDFLGSTLDSGHTDPEFIVGILATFLKGNLNPTFTVNKLPATI